MPIISFLILTYNTSSFIESFLTSLLQFIEKEVKSGKYEILILDNVSTDNTVHIIHNYLKDKNNLNITFIESEKNLGYAKGINKMASKAHGEILIVINPDSVLIDADFEKIINEYRKNSSMAIAGFKMVNGHGKPEKSVGHFFNPFTFILYCMGLGDQRFSLEKRGDVDFLSGGFISFRKTSFEKLNGYDSDYFMYVEDMDICFRAKEAGYKVLLLPYATLQHAGQGSSNREFAIVNIYRGLQLFFEKNSSFLMTQYVKNLLTVKAAFIIFMSLLSGKKALASTYQKALKTIS